MATHLSGRGRVPPTVRGTCVLLTILLAASMAAVPARAAHRVSCGQGHTVQANAKARVFWVGHRLYACASRARKPLLLYREEFPCPAEASSGCDAVDRVRLAGRFVGVDWELQQRDEVSAGVDVFDVAGRKRVRGYLTPSEAGWSYGISDIELTPRGGLGVLTVARSQAFGSASSYEVRKRDVNGSALLDSGPDIDPRSLALAEHTLYWSRGGVAHAAAIR
jgi:hypothetical protein